MSGLCITGRARGATRSALGSNASDRLDDLAVGTAPAEVTGHRAANLIVGGIGGAREQRLRGEDLTGRAETTLHRVVTYECLLHRIQPTVDGEPFDRRDLVPLALERERDARVNRTPIQKNCTGAALPEVTDPLGAGESEVEAKCVEELATRLEIEPIIEPVDPQRHRSRTRTGDSDHYRSDCRRFARHLRHRSPSRAARIIADSRDSPPAI